MTNDITKLGPKDFITGCLVVVVAIFVVPILVLVFKLSIYLALVIGVIVALVLGVTLLGRLMRLLFFKRPPDDQNQN